HRLQMPAHERAGCDYGKLMTCPSCRSDKSRSVWTIVVLGSGRTEPSPNSTLTIVGSGLSNVWEGSQETGLAQLSIALPLPTSTAMIVLLVPSTTLAKLDLLVS